MIGRTKFSVSLYKNGTQNMNRPKRLHGRSTEYKKKKKTFTTGLIVANSYNRA